MLGKALAQPTPDLRAERRREQRAVLVAELRCRLARSLAFRSVEESLQEVAPQLAELRARQRRAHDAVARDALVRRQSRGDVLELLAQRRSFAQRPALQHLVLVRYDHRGQHAAALENPDF